MTTPLTTLCEFHGGSLDGQYKLIQDTVNKVVGHPPNEVWIRSASNRFDLNNEKARR